MTTLAGGRLLAGLVLTAIAAVSGAAEPASDLKFKNIMTDFWSFQDQVPQLQKADRILRRFREQIIEPNRDIYSRPEFKDAITDEGILGYLQQVGPDLPAMRTLSLNLEQRTLEVVKRFQQQFPRFDDRLTVIFLPSLNRIDGQFIRILDQPALLIGLDAIARFRGASADFGVVLTHELFHAYHARTNAALYREELTPLYVRIWTEGLAAYASERVNPQAANPQIIGDVIAPIGRNASQVGPVVNLIRGSLDSTDPVEQDKYLTYTAAASGVPQRAGYLVGYEIAKALAEKIPMNDLASLRGSKLRNLMRKQLEEMAAGYLAQQENNNQGGPGALQSSSASPRFAQ